METLTKKIVTRKKDSPVHVAIFSNGPELPTGYAKVIREIAIRLANDGRFRISFMNENYGGQKAAWNGFDVYPCHNQNMGEVAKTFVEKLQESKADIVIILEDSFTLKNFGFENIIKIPQKRIFYIPLDGDWVPTTGINVIRSMDKIVSMAKFTQDTLAKEGFESDMIYHGVDLDLFSPVSMDAKRQLRQMVGLDENDFVIFNYGRNSLRKNNQALIHIACSYLKTAPANHKVLFHIMEKEDEHLNLVDFIDRHMKSEFDKEVLDRLIFTNHNHANPATDHQVAAMIQMSDLVVSASTGEGFGLLMAEAMACGKPVVHTDYTTPFELLTDTSMGVGERGWTVPPAAKHISSFNTEHAYVDKEKYVELLNQIVQDPTEMKRRGANGRYFAEKYLNWDYLVEEWKTLILKMV